jgi:tetratricopeptide (TPR) repeat protein
MVPGEEAYEVPDERSESADEGRVVPDTVSGGEAETSSAFPAEGAEAAQRAGGEYLNGVTLRFAVGVILLMAAGGLGAVFFAQAPNETVPMVAAFVFGVLICAGIICVTWGFSQVRAQKRALLRSAYLEGYSRGYRAKQGSRSAGSPDSCPGTDGKAHSLNDRIAAAQAKPHGPAPEAADPVESLLAHTDDVFATLTSLVSNPDPDRQYQGIRQLLLGIGLPEWESAEKATCRLLGRNGCYWIAAQTEALPVDDYDRIMATEGALNLAKGVRLAHPQLAPDDYPAKARELLCQPIRVRSGVSDVISFLEAGYADPAQALKESEWAQRLAVADAAEDTALPFRLVFDMRANAAAGLMLIRLEIPRPACFASVAADDADRRRLAVVYAQHLAIFMAEAAFRVPATRQAVVSCHEHDSLRTVLSLQANAADALRLGRRAQQEAGWFDDPTFRASFSDDGWFGAIEPHLRETDDVLEPERYELPTELDTRPCNPGLSRIACARTAADLGINENAERQWTWHRFADDLPISTREAVSRLLALKDQAAEPPTKDACDRVIRALAEGEGALPAIDELRTQFFDGTELDEAVAQARLALTSNDAPKVADAVTRLEAALSTSMQISYLDDTDTVFRYFNSVAERIAYNRRYADDTRDVRLVPDAYFNALELSARLLTMLERNDEALRYAEEATRIAPGSVNAALVKARVLENKSDVFGAADCVKAVMGRATSKHDLSICLYRMAYFAWKLGRSKLSVACYKAAIALRTSLSAQAALELAQLIATEEGVSDISGAEAKALLNEADIPYELDRPFSQCLQACAILCTDQHFYPVAASLTGSLVELLRDDALVDVYHSLVP